MASMADAPAGDIRSTILAELSAQPDAPAATDAPVEAAVEDAPAAEETPDDTETVEASADDDAAPVDDDEDDPDLVSDDPKVQKGLDQVRVAEKRMRAMLDRDKAAFEVERQKWQGQVDKIAEFESLAKRAKYDPAAALRALGVADDDFELAAHALYAESKSAAADPKQKAAALARLKEREKEDKLSATEKRIADLEAKLEQQRAEASVQAEAAAYIQQINATAAAKYPLVAQYLKVDQDDTADKLVAEYNRLSETLKRAPKPVEVVAAFDKRERARLAKLGIDPATIVKTKPVANTNATKKPAAKSAANANAQPDKGIANNGDPDKDTILAELATLTS